MFCFLVTCGKLAVLPLYIIKKKKREKRRLVGSLQDAIVRLGELGYYKRWTIVLQLGTLYYMGMFPCFCNGFHIMHGQNLEAQGLEEK